MKTCAMIVVVAVADSVFDMKPDLMRHTAVAMDDELQATLKSYYPDQLNDAPAQQAICSSLGGVFDSNENCTLSTEAQRDMKELQGDILNGLICVNKEIMDRKECEGAAQENGNLYFTTTELCDCNCCTYPDDSADEE